MCSSDLSWVIRIMVLATFQSLNQNGRTIILITHEHDVAMHAKRIIHIRDGLILKDERIN